MKSKPDYFFKERQIINEVKAKSQAQVKSSQSTLPSVAGVVVPSNLSEKEMSMIIIASLFYFCISDRE